jgi:peptidoglycan/xylan/chitin deacetylase (PgdA/CDA1 family)
MQLGHALLVFAFAIGPWGDGGSRQSGPPRTLQVPILMYHYISANPKWPQDPVRTHLSLTPSAFAAQLRYLKAAKYTTITLDDLVDALNDGTPLPAHPIILTFDDGYQDFYANAYPILRKFNDQATIYIITAKVGQAGYMTWDELRQLALTHLITIGAHTRTHPDLSVLPALRSWNELSGSKADLERKLGITVRHFAYPSGEYSPTVLRQAAEIGFATAVTTHEGFSQRSDQLLTLPRVRVNGYTGLADLITGLRGQRTALAHPAHNRATRPCQAQLMRELDYCPARPTPTGTPVSAS